MATTSSLQQRKAQKVKKSYKNSEKWIALAA
jgi:hypothetical protein